VCLDNPDVVLIIKSSEARTPVTAGQLAQRGAEAFLITATDYVREVFVAKNQPTSETSKPTGNGDCVVAHEPDGSAGWCTLYEQEGIVRKLIRRWRGL